MTINVNVKLCNIQTGAEVKRGDTATTFRGEAVTVRSFAAPARPGSTGRVNLSYADHDTIGFASYPSVIGCEFRTT